MSLAGIVQGLVLSCLYSLCSSGMSEFLPYGTTAGDQTESIRNTGFQINLDTPFVYYGTPQTELNGNIAGFLSFGRSDGYRRYVGSDVTLPINSSFELGETPFLAPLWSSLTLTVVGGNVFYRSSSDPTLIRAAVARLAEDDEDLRSEFLPSLVVVLTWSEVAIDENEPLKNVTFQVVLLTDGRRSFALYLYGFVHPDARYLTGFNAGDRVRGVVISSTDEAVSTGTPLGRVAFRTDGPCISAVSLSCPFNASSTDCSVSPPFQSHVCECLEGYLNSTGSCQDIDECAEGLVMCPEGSSCVNTLGNYTCPCHDGYYGDDFTICINVDECSLNIDTCGGDATCTDSVGSFSCSCNPGFLGDGRVCTEEGAVTSCTRGVADCVCEGLTGNNCYCAPGFNITSGNTQSDCEDINECADGTAQCGERSRCVNTLGSFLCACQQGYQQNSTGHCININECAVSGLNDCHDNATCNDTEGSFTCSCQQGFNGDGRNCFPGDICSEGTHRCEQICLPVDSTSFECLCRPGYLLARDGISCIDRDECSLSVDNCHEQLATCENTEGSFTCTCNSGYIGNGIICEDIDECEVGLGICAVNETCTNRVGGFDCDCAEGFFEDPNNPGPCFPGVAPDVIVTPFTRPISSLNYSIGRVNDFCVERNTIDPDELITVWITCQPIPGIFPEPQDPIWNVVLFEIGSNQAAFDDTLPDQNLYPDIEITNNGTLLQIGPVTFQNFGLAVYKLMFRCRVNNLFNFHTESIIISECGPTECQHGITNNCTTDCMRSEEQYTCLCEDGFTLADDGVSCNDINECHENYTLCSDVEVCMNTIGSFRCACIDGYRTNEQGQCQDVDECSDGSHNCSELSTFCVNTNGSYTCDCLSGYKPISPTGPPIFATFCEDINECDRGEDDCLIVENCVNVDGSFNCSCKNGYSRTGENFTCSDVDECALSLHNCLGSCRNTDGSFMCMCPEGFKLARNMYSCEDVNECADPTSCGSNALCVNLNGTFDCQCGPTYQKRGNSCEISQVVLIPVICVSCLVLILLVGILFVIIFIISRRRLKVKYNVDRRQSNDYVLSATLSSPLSMMELPEVMAIPPSLMIPLHQLVLDNKVLGSGEFGIVHKASYRGETVAVKTLKGFFDNSSIAALVDEIQKMKDFSHLNILTLMGVTLDNRGSPCIIMPFMSNGSLVEYLRRDRVRSELLLKSDSEEEFVNKASQKLMNFCLQIGNGMEYLSSKKVIHRDLAARNCMMDIHHVIKVADFGLSVSVTDDKDYFRAGEFAAEKLPVKWMAPESLTERKFSELTDVWSYGITCWEVFSCGKVPYPTIKAIELLAQIRDGYKMEKPENKACTDEMYQLMLNCWAYEPTRRPTFAQIVTQCSDILAMASDYLSFDTPFTPSTTGSFPEKGEDILANCHTLHEQEEDAKRGEGPNHTHKLLEEVEREAGSNRKQEVEGINHTHKFHEEVDKGEGFFSGHTLVKQDLELRTDDEQKLQELEPEKRT